MADVYPCMALEDFDVFQGLHVASEKQSGTSHSLCPSTPPTASLADLGLADIKIDPAHISESCKNELTQLPTEFQDIFSKHPLDCGEVREYTHRIRLSDDRPFRLPYRGCPLPIIRS